MTTSSIAALPITRPQETLQFSEQDKIYAIAGKTLLAMSFVAATATVIVGCIVTIPPIGVALATIGIMGMFIGAGFIIPIPVQAEESLSDLAMSPTIEKTATHVEAGTSSRAHAILAAHADNPSFLKEATSMLEAPDRKYKAEDSTRITQFKLAYLPELKKDLTHLKALAACFPDPIKSTLIGTTAETLYAQIDAALLHIIEEKQSITFFEHFIEGLFHSSIEGLTGLANTGNSCFMNAALQAIFADQALAGYILSSLEKLAHDDTLKEVNPSTDIHYTLAQEIIDPSSGKTKTTPCDRGALPDEKVAETFLADFLADTSQATEILRSLHTKTFAKSSAPESLSAFEQRKLFASLTLQEAAQIASTLLLKLKNKTPLSFQETIKLKLALIKLTVTRTEVTVTLREGSKPKTLLTLSKAISPFGAQEDSAEMVRLLVDSLTTLQKEKDPLPCPCIVGTKKTFHSYEDKPCTIPAGSETIHEGDIILPTSLIETSSGNFTIKLDEPESLAYLAPSFNKVTLGADGRDSTEPVRDADPAPMGDAIRYVKRHTEVTLPETLIITPPPSHEYGVRPPHLRFVFTDPETLTFRIQNNEVDSLREPTHYKLESFTLHGGGATLDAGHYIAYSRQVDTTTGCEFWVEYNDAHVRRVPESFIKALLAGEHRYHSANVLIFKKV